MSSAVIKTVLCTRDYMGNEIEEREGGGREGREKERDSEREKRNLKRGRVGERWFQFEG